VYLLAKVITLIKIRRRTWPLVKRDACRAVLSKPVEKRPLGRPRLRWENIKMGLRKKGWEDTDWIYLLWDRDKFSVLVKVVIQLQLP
jgi:hypothetical protein